MTAVSSWPRPEWTIVPRPGTTGVQMRLLDYTEGTQLLVQLRFETDSTIDEHDAPHPIDVYCLEGSGLTSVAGESAPIEAGQRVRWPAGTMHRLWTEADTMITLMHEHIGDATEHPSGS